MSDNKQSSHQHQSPNEPEQYQEPAELQETNKAAPTPEVQEHSPDADKKPTPDSQPSPRAGSDQPESSPLGQTISNWGKDLKTQININYLESLQGLNFRSEEVDSGENCASSKHFDLRQRAREDAKVDDETFGDPTEQMPPRPPTSDIPHMTLYKDVEEWSKRWSINRVLAVSCLDEKTRIAAAYALLSMPDFESLERRMLSFEGENKQLTDLSIATLADQKIGGGTDLVVTINIKSNRQFLDSMMRMDLLDFGSIVEKLANKGIWLICLISPPLHKDLKSNRPRFLHWEVPFLEQLLLRNHVREVSRIIERISQQRAAGLWGLPHDDEEFYETLELYLSEGPERLEEEVEKRHKSQAGELARFEEKRIDAEQVFSSADSVHRVVLYVAASFHNLSPHEFEQIVMVLLQGRSTSLEVERKHVTKKGKVRIFHEEEEKSLQEIWLEDPDTHLQKCHLKTVRSENDAEVIRFSLPYMKREMTRYLSLGQPIFRRRQFDRIIGLLFNPQISPEIVRNTIRLSVQMSLADPNRLAEDWLVEIVQGLKRQVDDFSSTHPNEIGRFLELLAHLEGNKHLLRLVFSRLSDLIRDMLDYPQLGSLVDRSLDQMLRYHEHRFALSLVFEITKRLRFAPQFDSLHWMKRLLEEGSGEVADETTKALHSHIRQMGRRIYELLEPLEGWLPPHDRPLTALSPSNRCSLFLFLDYSLFQAIRIDSRSYGTWPSPYPLFMTLSGQDRSDQPKLALLVRWLFHPALAAVIQGAVEDGELAWVVRADLLEFWYAILVGGEECQLADESIAVSQRLLNEVVASTNRSQKLKLVEQWRGRRTQYLTRLESLSIDQKAQREEWRGKYRLSVRLEKAFRQELHNQSSQTKAKGAA